MDKIIIMNGAELASGFYGSIMRSIDYINITKTI